MKRFSSFAHLSTSLIIISLFFNLSTKADDDDESQPPVIAARRAQPRRSSDDSIVMDVKSYATQIAILKKVIFGYANQEYGYPHDFVHALKLFESFSKADDLLGDWACYLVKSDWSYTFLRPSPIIIYKQKVKPIKKIDKRFVCDDRL